MFTPTKSARRDIPEMSRCFLIMTAILMIDGVLIVRVG